MRTIKIMSLHLENFKSHKSLHLDFMGLSAAIYGDNATGKTSVYDALTWLLFAKDSQGNGEKNMEVKPLDKSGNVIDHDAETSVSATMDVDGVLVTLRRTYREVWSTRRGSTEAIYTGNTSDYTVDGVPKSRASFLAYVEEHLCDEASFRMLTSVSHFAAGISWQERRKVLFDLAGTMSDQEIMGTDARFAPLIEGMGNLDLDDYKAKLRAEKKNFNATKTDVPARLSELQKTLDEVSSIDFEEAGKQLKNLKERRDSYHGQLTDIEHNTAAEAKKNELEAVRLSIRELSTENQAYRASQPDSSMEEIRWEQTIKGSESALAEQKKNLAFMQNSTVASADRRLQDLRTRWAKENSEEFHGDTVCPHCGQPLPPEKVQEAVNYFNAQKEKRLKAIEADAAAVQAEKDHAMIRIQELEMQVKEIEEHLTYSQGELQKAKEAKTPVVDMPGYVEKLGVLNTQAEALNNELAALRMDVDKAKLDIQVAISGLMPEIARLESVISKRDLIAYTEKRMDDLREDAKNAASALDALEKMLFLTEEFSRYKASFVESSINSRFRLAKFRLYKEQANGGVEDRCDVVYDGIPYGNLNNGMKINVGIDIINTLSSVYGVAVPLFIDNAESVTHLETCGSQTVRLVVSEADKELRVENEN